MIKKILIHKKISNYFVYLFVLFFVLIDQSSKYYIDKIFDFSIPIELIKNVISVQKVYNTGAAFSIMEGKVLLLACMSIFAVLCIVGYILKSSSKSYIFLSIAWGLLLGGTIGNLIDRVFHGYVIDFINLNFINFPVFNFADIFINVGAFIVITYIIFENTLNDAKKQN